MNTPTPDEVNALIERLQVKLYSELWTLRPEILRMLTALRDENARLKEDGALLDALEESIKREPLLLHNCRDSSEWPRTPLGLGLTPWSPRTLRKALRDCVLCPPESAESKQAREDEEAFNQAKGGMIFNAGDLDCFRRVWDAALAHARKERATP